MYTTSQLASRFKITDQTVKRYAAEFHVYLSPTATPEKGDTRLFTDDDLAVYDLIVSMKDQKQKFEQIHMALASGQRGNVVDMESDAITPQSAGQLRLLTRIRDLEAELEKERVARHDSDIARATAEGREKLLRELLAEAQTRIEKLIKGSG